MRLHAFEYRVEVIRIHFDKLALLEFWQGLFGIAGEIAKHAYYEGQLLDLDCAPDLDVVCNLHPGRTHPVELMLSTLFSHDEILKRNCDQRRSSVSSQIDGPFDNRPGG